MIIKGFDTQSCFVMTDSFTMKKNFKNTLVLVLGLQVVAKANDSVTLWGEDDFYSSTRFYLTGSLGLTQSSSDTLLESSKSGWAYHLGMNVGLPCLEVRYCPEVELGYFQSRISGEPVPQTPDNLLTPDRNYVKTSALYADGKILFRIRPKISIGPVLRFNFGQDVSFSPWDMPATPHMHIGAQVIKRDVGFRYGAGIYTDLTIAGRQLTWVQLIGQLTLNEDFPSTTPAQTPKPTATPLPEPTAVQTPTPAPQIIEKIVVQNQFIALFEAQFIHFELNKAILTNFSQAFLKDLGTMLAQQKENWGTVEIIGHTDAQGNHNHNLQLSMNRARSVAFALFYAGVPNDKIFVNGLGATQLLDKSNTQTAHARNRRVEFKFNGIKDYTKFTVEFNRVKALHMKPETCQGNTCR